MLDVGAGLFTFVISVGNEYKYGNHKDVSPISNMPPIEV